MSCPDIHDLIDTLVDGPPDESLEAHLKTCSSCRAVRDLVRAIPAAFEARQDVPEVLVQRVMAQVPREGLSAAKPSAPDVHTLGSGILAWLTAAAAIVATGSGAGGNPTTFLLVSLVVTFLATVAQLWLPEEWDVEGSDRKRRGAT